MPNQFQGTINLLGNLAQQKQASNLQIESPQYQAALGKLIQEKQMAAFKFQKLQELNSLDPSDINGRLRILGELGEPSAVKELSDIKQKKQDVLLKINEQFKIPFATPEEKQTSIKVIQDFTQGRIPVLPFEKRPRGSLVNINLDPEERSFQIAEGKARSAAVQGLGSIGAIKTDMDNLFTLYGKIDSTFKGPIAGRSIGQIAKFLQTDPNIRAYEDLRELNVSNIVKTVGREVGVLTDKDIARIKSAQPNLWDSPETAALKERFFYNYVDNRVKDLQIKAKKPVTGIEIPGHLKDISFDVDKLNPWETEGAIKKDEDMRNSLQQSSTPPGLDITIPQQNVNSFLEEFNQRNR